MSTVNIKQLMQYANNTSTSAEVSSYRPARRLPVMRIKRKAMFSPMYSHDHPNKQTKPNRQSKPNKKEADEDNDSEFNFEGQNVDLGAVFGKTVYSVDNNVYFRSGVNLQSVTQLINIINAKNLEFEEVKKNPLIKNVQPNEINLHICSGGGSLFAGFMAVDAILGSVIPINTIVHGYCASAASLMSVVGKKKYMTARSYILIHQLSSGNSGTYNQLKDDHINNTKLMEGIESMYLSNTKLTKGDLDSLLKRDLWLSGSECLKYGLVDGIYNGLELQTSLEGEGETDELDENVNNLTPPDNSNDNRNDDENDDELDEENDDEEGDEDEDNDNDNDNDNDFVDDDNNLD
jgi:ATP-dependent protease ClpP protease subunit